MQPECSPLPRLSYRMSMQKPVPSITGSLEELQEKLILWKTNMEGKGLRVNMGKTKFLISGPGIDVLQKFGKDACGVCLKGVGTSSIFYGCSS